MMLQTTYRITASLSSAGHRLLDRRLEEQRQLYNAALDERITAYRMARHTITRAHQSRQLTGLRQDLPEYGSIHRRVSVGTLDRLDRVYQRHVKSLAAMGKGKPTIRVGRPRFKATGRFRTLEAHAGADRFLRRTKSGKRAHLVIKGLPRLVMRWDDRLPVSSADGSVMQPSHVSVTRTPKRVTVSLTYNWGEPPEKPTTPPENPIGLHPGVIQRMTAAARTNFLLMERRATDQRQVARLQRKMARQQRSAITDGRATWQRKFNGRFQRQWQPMDPDDPHSRRYGQQYRKTVSRLANLRQGQTEANMGYLHEVSSSIVSEYDAICIEEMPIREMAKSAAGTSEAPGEGVTRRRNLNRSILEQTWGRFADLLEYKAERAGVPFVRVPAAYNSVTCHACGVTDPSSRMSRERFRCAHCEFDGDAEDNAARNVLSQGLAMLGSGEDGTMTRRRTGRDLTAGITAVGAGHRRAKGAEYPLME